MSTSANHERLVTTLPITPRNERNINTLLQPLGAHMLSRFKMARFIVSVNNQGFATENQGVHSDELIKDYSDCLEGAGIIQDKKREIWADTDPLYAPFFQEVVSELSQNGMLTINKKELNHCECGRVEQPTESYESRRSKGTTLTTTDCDKRTCVVCSSDIKTSMRDCLALKIPPQPAGITIFPSKFADKANLLMQEELDREWVVSRHFRDGKKVEVNSEEFTVDTEFYWLGYLGFLATQESATDLSVVTGHKTFTKLMRALSLTKILNSNVTTEGLLLPSTRFTDSKYQLSTMTAEQFNELPYSKTARRLFLAHSFKWSGMESSLDSSKLHLSQQAARNLSHNSVQFTGSSDTSDFLKVLSPPNLDTFVKGARKNNIKCNNPEQVMHMLESSDT